MINDEQRQRLEELRARKRRNHEQRTITYAWDSALFRWLPKIEIVIWIGIAYAVDDTPKANRLFLIGLALYILNRLQDLAFETNRQINSFRQALRRQADFLQEHYTNETTHQYSVANAIVSLSESWQDPFETVHRASDREAKWHENLLADYFPIVGTAVIWALAFAVYTIAKYIWRTL